MWLDDWIENSWRVDMIRVGRAWSWAMTLAVIITLESEILRLVIAVDVITELLLEPVKLSGG